MCQIERRYILETQKLHYSIDRMAFFYRQVELWERYCMAADFPVTACHLPYSCGGELQLCARQHYPDQLRHSMLAFLVAMSWVFFDGTDVTTQAVLSVILGLIALVTFALMVLEGAAGAAPGTTRHRISAWIVRTCTFSVRRTPVA